jgi:hypothetical protein
MLSELEGSVTENGVNYEPREVTVTPMSLPNASLLIHLQIQKKGGLPPPEIARHLFETFGAACEVWTPGCNVPFAEDAASWIRDQLLRPFASDYLKRLESLERGDDSLASEAAENLLRIVESKTATVVTSLPIAGLRTAGDLSSGRVTIRPLTARELGALNESVFDAMENARRLRVAPWVDHRDERHVLEVTAEGSKKAQPSTDIFVGRLILALQLLGFEPHGSGRSSTWTSRNPSGVTFYQSHRLPQRGATRPIEEESLASAVALAEAIPTSAVAGPLTKREVALHRFHLGAGEELAADSLVDYTVALEALLLPEKFEGELRFRFSLYGALFLEGTSTDRKQNYRDLKSVYDTRSALVHGLKPPSADDVRDARITARSLASRMLIKALRQGWPSEDALVNAALSA